MPSALRMAGSEPQRPTRYVPITASRFFTGLWTQRSPLREAAVPYLYEKFYSGARFDSLIAGQNVEISSRLTLIRRPGLSSFNASSFPAIQAFQAFRTQSAGVESIQVLADSAAAVYDATNGAKTALLTKAAGAGQTRFQPVGNVLYLADGVELKKYLKVSGSWVVQNAGGAAPANAPQVSLAALPDPYPVWAADTFYSPSLLIVDSNDNLQLLTTAGTTGSAEPAWATAAGATTTDGSAVWTCQGTAAWQANHAYAAGAYIAATWTVTVSYQYYDAYTRQYETGYATTTYKDFFQCTTAGTSGAAAPAWQSGLGSTTVDDTVVWTDQGAQITWTAIGATTLVATDQAIQDSNNNLQQVTAAGKSGAAVPTWKTSTGAYTADGTASWRCAGPPALGPANSGQWYYGYCFYSDLTQACTTLSPLSVGIELQANNYVAVQGSGSGDSQYTKIRLFRSTQQVGSAVPATMSEMLFLADIAMPAGGAAGTWTYNDTIADDGLNEFIQAPLADHNDAPPASTVAMAYHLGLMWYASGTTVWYSRVADAAPGIPLECVPPSNYFTFPAAVVRIEPCPVGLLVFTASDVGLIAGTNTSNSPLYAVTNFVAGVGLANYNALTSYAGTFYLFSRDSRLLTLRPYASLNAQVAAVETQAELQEAGFPIGDQLATWNQANVYLTWHRGGTTDVSLFVSDGATGWFRMSAAAPPENALIWSPFAKVTGGCGAVQSIETSPGVYKLLVGPSAAGGAILQRDWSTFADAGTPYTAFARIGSIMLAQSGNQALVDFISVEGPAAGSAPTLGVLVNEISGTPTALSNSTNDNWYQGLPSTTLYALRFWMSQTRQAAICRHLQVEIDWAAEDAANELYGYTIFAAQHVG